MKNWILKISAAFIFAGFTAVSCNTAAKTDPSDLPKDIAERPVDETSQKYDAAQLDKIKTAIENSISKEKCSDVADWAFAPMGKKACGGPVTYIAYPKKNEKEILVKIEQYTQKMEAFNKKYSITSDCMMAAEPTGIECQNDKAVLVY